MSIAALTQIRFSQDLTLPPRNERRLRNAEKNASWTASDAWSRSGTIRTTSAKSWSWYSVDQVVEGVEVPVTGTLDEDEVAALDGVVGDRRRAKVLHGRGVPPDGDCG